jgi:hypothetical protein
MFGVYVTRINRGFSGFNEGVHLNPCRDYTQQISHTLSGLMAHKRESSNISVVHSVLIILGCSLLPFSQVSWSSADLTSLRLNHYSLHLHLYLYLFSLCISLEAQSYPLKIVLRKLNREHLVEQLGCRVND